MGLKVLVESNREANVGQSTQGFWEIVGGNDCDEFEDFQCGVVKGVLTSVWFVQV